MFFDLEPLSNVFLAMFFNKEISFALCVSLIPWIFWGDMKWRFHLPCFWCKVESKNTKSHEVLHSIQNLMTNARCMPSGQLTSSWVSSWSILDTRQGILAEVGSLPIALDVKFSATFSWSSLGMVFVELKLSCTQLWLHHFTFLEMVCLVFCPKNKIVKNLSQRDEHEQWRRHSKITHTVIGGQDAKRMKVDCNSTQPPFCCVSNFLKMRFQVADKGITVIFVIPFRRSLVWKMMMRTKQRSFPRECCGSEGDGALGFGKFSTYMTRWKHVVEGISTSQDVPWSEIPMG